MLYETLKFLCDQLNAKLGSGGASGDPSVVVDTLCSLDGTVPHGIDNKLVLSLVNVERDATGTKGGGKFMSHGSGFTQSASPLNLNLYVLVSASFNEYAQALRMLSGVLGYFQASPVLTPHSSSDFPRGLDKLTMEIVNLDMQGLNNMWGNLGGRYLPSVVYKARMLSVDAGWVSAQVGRVNVADTAI